MSTLTPTNEVYIRFGLLKLYSHSLSGKAVGFTLLRHNNTRSGKIYVEFSIGMHFSIEYYSKK